MLGDLGIGMFAHRMDMLETPITGLGFGECTNAMIGLEHACMLVETGRANTVLLISTDVACAKEQRMTSGQTICSDGAAACIVSREPYGNGYSFELLAFAKAFHHLSRANMSNPAKAFRDISTAAVRCKKDVTSRVDAPIAKWIPNTGSHEVAKAFSSVLGIPTKDFYMANLAKNAHVFSTDQLINLLDWAAEFEVQAGTVACGVATGLSGSSVAAWKVSRTPRSGIAAQ
jgi:3-oxoacyl-[acyl-carrier-protein] synthase-3